MDDVTISYQDISPSTREGTSFQKAAAISFCITYYLLLKPGAVFHCIHSALRSQSSSGLGWFLLSLPGRTWSVAVERLVKVLYYSKVRDPLTSSKVEEMKDVSLCPNPMMASHGQDFSFVSPMKEEGTPLSLRGESGSSGGDSSGFGKEADVQKDPDVQIRKETEEAFSGTNSFVAPRKEEGTPLSLSGESGPLGGDSSSSGKEAIVQKDLNVQFGKETGEELSFGTDSLSVVSPLDSQDSENWPSRVSVTDSTTLTSAEEIVREECTRQLDSQEGPLSGSSSFDSEVRDSVNLKEGAEDVESVDVMSPVLSIEQENLENRGDENIMGSTPAPLGSAEANGPPEKLIEDSSSHTQKGSAVAPPKGDDHSRQSDSGTSAASDSESEDDSPSLELSPRGEEAEIAGSSMKADLASTKENQENKDQTKTSDIAGLVDVGAPAGGMQKDSQELSTVKREGGLSDSNQESEQGGLMSASLSRAGDAVVLEQREGSVPSMQKESGVMGDAEARKASQEKILKIFAQRGGNRRAGCDRTINGTPVVPCTSTCTLTSVQNASVHHVYQRIFDRICKKDRKLKLVDQQNIQKMFAIELDPRCGKMTLIKILDQTDLYRCFWSGFCPSREDRGGLTGRVQVILKQLHSCREQALCSDRNNRKLRNRIGEEKFWKNYQKIKLCFLQNWAGILKKFALEPDCLTLLQQTLEKQEKQGRVSSAVKGRIQTLLSSMWVGASWADGSLCTFQKKVTLLNQGGFSGEGFCSGETLPQGTWRAVALQPPCHNFTSVAAWVSEVFCGGVAPFEYSLENSISFYSLITSNLGLAEALTLLRRSLYSFTRQKKSLFTQSSGTITAYSFKEGDDHGATLQSWKDLMQWALVQYKEQWLPVDKENWDPRKDFFSTDGKGDPLEKIEEFVKEYDAKILQSIRKIKGRYEKEFASVGDETHQLHKQMKELLLSIKEDLSEEELQKNKQDLAKVVGTYWLAKRSLILFHILWNYLGSELLELISRVRSLPGQGNGMGTTTMSGQLVKQKFSSAQKALLRILYWAFWHAGDLPNPNVKEARDVSLYRGRTPHE